jgi:hypothetical protein
MGELDSGSLGKMTHNPYQRRLAKEIADFTNLPTFIAFSDELTAAKFCILRNFL